MPTKKPAKKAPLKTAKKAVKKTAVKKAPAKKNAKALVYADNETSFWVSDGQILNSLEALREALETMEKAVYQNHVNKEKNDFSEWVRVVLCDDDCAKALLTAKTPKSAKTVVVKHLKLYAI